MSKDTKKEKQQSLITRIPWDRVNWETSIFLAIINTLAVTAVPLYIWNYGVDWFQLSLFAFFYCVTGLSITLGYHRLFSHLSFKASPPVKLTTLVFGACAFENSALNWASDHRKHHKHVDHDDDPYDISKGFFWAHIGWLLFKLKPEQPMDNVRDLQRDPLVMWQHRWCLPLAFGVGFGVPLALGYMWGGFFGALGAFLLAGVLRVFAVQHSTFFINSMCHTVGSQPYSARCSARDSSIMALFTFGEGYHNYHHEFQHDYRNGVKKSNFDPTKWIIWLLDKLGLASDLRRVPEEKILIAEITEQRRLLDKEIDLLVSSEPQPPLDVIEKVTEYKDRLVEEFEGLTSSISERIKTAKLEMRRWQNEVNFLLNLLEKIRKAPESHIGSFR